MQFINEYGELETVDPSNRAEAFSKTVGKASGEGGYWKVTL